MNKVEKNKLVPDFSLHGTSDLDFSLKNYIGKNVVLYFYPRDSTPGCTNEGIDFTNLYKNFQEKNVEIFGISRDNLNSHEKFKNKYNFPFELLSDSEEIACNLFDVIKMKNMYGKQVQGIERSTFLIDEKGILINEWRGLKVPGHAEEVLNSIL